MASYNTKRQRQAWTAERLREQALGPVASWSPLDGVDAPEYIPEFWIGPHVGLRMIEAFKTLACLPSGHRGRTASGYWPEYWPEWEDLLAREQSDAQLKEEQARAQNRVRMAPSAQDISRMEIVISWSGTYLAPADARLVQRVALLRSQDREIEVIAHRLRRSPRELRRTNRVGLDRIADGLRLARVAVF